MAHTKGKWALMNDHQVVSTTEFEEWSVGIEDEEPEPKRVLSVLSAMGGEDVVSDLALIIASPCLLHVARKMKKILELSGEEPELVKEAEEIIRRAEDPKLIPLYRKYNGT